MRLNEIANERMRKEALDRLQEAQELQRERERRLLLEYQQAVIDENNQ